MRIRVPDSRKTGRAWFAVGGDRAALHAPLAAAFLFGWAGMAILAGCDSRSGASGFGGGYVAGNAKIQWVRPWAEYQGEIRRVVIHVPEGKTTEIKRAIVDLIRALDETTRISLFCNGGRACEELRHEIEKPGLEKRGNLEEFCSHGELSIWARDRYISTRPVRNGAISRWVVPQLSARITDPMRQNERRVPGIFAQAGHLIEVVETPLVLEGGNVVAMRDRILMGANVFFENLERAEPKRVNAELRGLFGLPIVFVADESGATPSGHLDLYVTGLGDDVVMVGSPALAREVMAGADEGSRKALATRLLGEADFSEERSARFDQVARRLEGEGFRVVRVPLADNRGGDFMVSYNNVIQEERGGKHVVYMPVYGVSALDAAARRVFEGEGCEVREIDVSGVSHLLGAVRCLANVVEREQAGG